MNIEEVLEENNIRERIKDSIREEAESKNDDTINENEEFFIDLVDSIAKKIDSEGSVLGRAAVEKAMGLVVAAGTALGAIGGVGLVGLGSKLNSIIKNSKEIKDLIKTDRKLSDIQFKIDGIERKAKNPRLITNPKEFAKDIQDVNNQMKMIVKKAKMENIEDSKSIKALESIQRNFEKSLKKAAKKAEKEARNT